MYYNDLLMVKENEREWLRASDKQRPERPWRGSLASKIQKQSKSTASRHAQIIPKYVLFTMDDIDAKLEELRRRNEELEAQAQISVARAEEALRARSSVSRL
jgi:predicted nucleic acid-binding Zn ribbon protein